MSTGTISEDDLKAFRAVEPELLDLRTPLVSSGMTQRLLTRGENSTLRVLCYAPSRGEDHGLHGHVEEEHYFIVLQGAAQFHSLNGPLPLLKKNEGIFLPKGCFYEFYNPTEEPLVVLRIGASAQKAVAAMKDGDILCLENTRFRKEEEKNDPAFVAELAKLGDIWVNDAFSAAHRAHASTEGLGHKLPAYAGRTMQAELDALEKALEAPTKPVIAIIGGAKVST